jgi:predicted O-methyltransferase YrrM
VSRLLRRREAAATDERAPATHARADGGIDYYGGVVVGAEAIGARALDPETLDGVFATLDRLEADDYARYVRDFVSTGRAAAGAAWRYADILTALAAAAELLRPRSYLEIGVRRGRSLAVVGAAAPDCALVGIDLWQPGYAGMENPGPGLVRSEVAAAGHRGELELLTGDSHEVLPALFEERPELAFDLVTVDGDHSPRGAEQDLEDVLPRLRIGGALVFDDLRHPTHPELDAVWRGTVEARRGLSTWRFDDVGYGVGVAVRRW